MKAEKNYYNEITFRHWEPIQIRFDDIDGMGHVNNTILLSYFDYGKVKYLNAINALLTEEERMDVVIVRYETDFFKSVLLNESIVVESAVVGIGVKSVVFVQRICTKDEIKCICKTILSGFNKTDQTSKEIKQAFKERVAQYEENPKLAVLH